MKATEKLITYMIKVAAVSVSVEASLYLFGVRAEPVVIIMLSSDALRRSSSLFVDRQCINIRPRIVAGQDMNFIVIVTNSLGEFHEATSD